MMFFIVSALTLAAGHGHADVDAIYNSIRNSQPKYQATETIHTFQNEGMQIVATLTVPNTPEKVPIVLTFNGFLGTRDEAPIGGSDEGILKRNARIFAEQGIATLRVDFRGAGDSDGDYSFTSFTRQISDALTAIEYVRKNLKHQVDANSIGLLGFSQGGLVSSCTAGRSKDVDAIVLWSAPAFPPYDYAGLLTREGMQAGVALEEGETIVLPLYLNGQPLGLDAHLGSLFFDDMFTVQPTAAVTKFRKPMMYVSGLTDIIVWPQPTVGDSFLRYHDGPEKLVTIDADHAFDYWDTNHEKLDDAIYWSLAWFLATLN
ncbi:MAG: alpha/beta fold hydrolase [bacterium]|nr:alpha/beta fold hydrolase [bacterium]